MPMARAALWYQLLDLNRVDLRAGFFFRLAEFLCRTPFDFLACFLGMSSSQRKTPDMNFAAAAEVSPSQDWPPAASIVRAGREV